MIFAHDTTTALRAAVALANSALEPDTLTSTDDLHRFYVEHEYSGRHTGDLAELEEVRTLRWELRTLLTSDRDDLVEQTNRMLREAGAVPQLVRHDGWDWHLHAVGAERSFAERITVETAMAMVDVVRADELSRLAVCADESCQGVVLDLSRNRSRRYCSTTCSNRNAVAAYRARRR